MNLARMRVKTLQVMREYSNNGEINANSVNLDYLLSLNNFFDTAQKDIAQTKKIKRVYPFSQYSVMSGLGEGSGFDMIRKVDDEQEMTLVGATSYVFSTDNTSTIYVEENISGTWTELDVITNTTKGSFTQYKGLITASDSNNEIRVRFSGAYAYNITNYALFDEPFETVNDIPDFAPDVEYSLPSNFYKLDKVFVSKNGKYQEYTSYKFTPDKKIRINYFETGNFEVHYDAMPADIPFDPDDLNVGADYEFELDTEAQELVPLRAAYFALRDEPKIDLSSLLNEYYIALNNLDPEEGQYNEAIQTVYTM